MPRPVGDVRQALLQAAPVAWPGAAAGLPAAKLAEAAQVQYDAARRTVSRMVDAGELVIVGVEPCDGRFNGQRNLYARPPEADAPGGDDAAPHHFEPTFAEGAPDLSDGPLVLDLHQLWHGSGGW